jgi:hypothetical protein
MGHGVEDALRIIEDDSTCARLAGILPNHKCNPAYGPNSTPCHVWRESVCM